MNRESWRLLPWPSSERELLDETWRWSCRWRWALAIDRQAEVKGPGHCKNEEYEPGRTGDLCHCHPLKGSYWRKHDAGTIDG